MQISTPTVKGTGWPDKATAAYGDLILDWSELAPGEIVDVYTDSSSHSFAEVDTVSSDGSVLWLLLERIGHRTCHLRTDPLKLYRR